MKSTRKRRLPPRRKTDTPQMSEKRKKIIDKIRKRVVEEANQRHLQ